MSRRVVTTLTLLVMVLGCLQFAQGVMGAHRYPAAVTLITIVGAVGMVAGWWAWQATHWRWLFLVVCLGAFASTGVNAGGAGVLTMMLGFALVTFGYGVWVGLGVVALLSVAAMVVEAAMGDAPRRSLTGDLVQVVAIAMMFSLGVVLGQLLRQLEAERRRNLELVDELRRSAGIEQELMLAEERARSARELHDGLGHQLTLVVLSLEYAERMRERDPAKAFDEVDVARQTASAALAHMRRWVRALNPPREQAVTGNGAFEAIAGSFRGTGLDVEVTHTGTERELGRASSLVALRMVQEGLTNVVRHSSADRVGLHLDWGEDELELRLRDNGGPTQSLVPGFGLRSLAERAGEIGGRFEARSTTEGVELCGAVPTGAR